LLRQLLMPMALLWLLGKRVPSLGHVLDEVAPKLYEPMLCLQSIIVSLLAPTPAAPCCCSCCCCCCRCTTIPLVTWRACAMRWRSVGSCCSITLFCASWHCCATLSVFWLLLLLLLSGERVPCDGEVLGGVVALDESMLCLQCGMYYFWQ
jgi:hypothetical protein